MAIHKIETNKKYRVLVSYRDSFGRPRNRKRIVNGTYKDALLVEAKMEQSISKGFDEEMTFKQLFFDYLKHKNNVQEETIRKEKEIYTKYLNLLSGNKVKKLKPINILKLRNEIEKKDGSVTQKNKALFLLKRIMKHGHRYYDFNDYSDQIDMFKKSVKEKFVYQTYTPEEFYYVLDYIKEENYKLLYEIYFWAGLRRGEALALAPQDLLEKKELRINKSLNSFQEIGTPKNTSSYRNVKVHDELYYRLVPYSNSKGISLLSGDIYLPPSTVNGKFTRAIKRANKDRLANDLYELPHIRVHDLRHSHATFLASQGIPITAISARLGHSSINETMNTYMHLFRGDEEKVIDTIQDWINQDD